MKQRVFLSAAVGALMLTACGGGEAETDAPERAETSAAQGESASASSVSVEAPEAFQTAPEATGESDAYLASFAELENTETTETGLVLQTIEEGTGRQPDADDLIKLHFVARRAGDEEPFESTYRNGAPVVLTAGQTLPGWAEAVQMMKAGGKARAAIPPALAFGAFGMEGGPVGANEVVVFDLDLLDVIDNEDEEALQALKADAEAQIAGYSEEAQRQQNLAQAQALTIAAVNTASSQNYVRTQGEREDTETTESGLVYEVLTDGGEDDGASPAIGDIVRVHYRGTLPDGEEFDSSYSRGEPTEFELGRVIAGWNEGLQLMQPGDKYKFYIPANLAYGQRGAGELIGPNQALVFEVELLEVKPAETLEEGEE
ncbi:FKBP-type peptidyl-prolyl cis-trans isomerase [Parvularcula maris]|uniref:FKBP-type peptidyl-prolyl cis-trans isomerase n=1 Tax=Parvularcula maris TaxID=2965077 RepID=UPI00351A4271